MAKPRGILDQGRQVGIEGLLLLVEGLYGNRQFSLLVLQFLYRFIQCSFHTIVASLHFGKLSPLFIHRSSKVDNGMPSRIHLQSQSFHLLQTDLKGRKDFKPTLHGNKDLRLNLGRRRLRYSSNGFPLKRCSADGQTLPHFPTRPCSCVFKDVREGGGHGGLTGRKQRICCIFHIHNRLLAAPKVGCKVGSFLHHSFISNV